MTNTEKTSGEYFADMMAAVDTVADISERIGQCTLDTTKTLSDLDVLLVERAEAMQAVRLLALSL